MRGRFTQVIFRSDADRQYYLERLEEYCQRYGCTIYAYMLIGEKGAGYFFVERRHPA
jgi:hypothetical protein